MLQQDEPDDYVVATGETHSVRRFCEIAFGHVGPDVGGPRRRSTRSSCGPPRSTCSSATPSKAEKTLGWAAAARRFEDLVTMMVDADIELLSGRLQGHQLITRPVAGGVGRGPPAGRARAGACRPPSVTAIVNVGDDVELHGLHISPDLDTITYTLAGAIDPERGLGPGRRDLARDGGARPLPAAPRLVQPRRPRPRHPPLPHRPPAGRRHRCPRSRAEIAAAWGLGLRPAARHRRPRCRRMVTVAGRGRDRLPGVLRAAPARRRRARPCASTAPTRPARPRACSTRSPAAERVVIAPSNPIVSIDPVLAVPGVRDAVEARRDDVVAVSPIVAGAALKGPADRLLRELGPRGRRWSASPASTLPSRPRS